MKAFGVGIACPAHWTLADCPMTLWRAEGTRGARVVWELAGVLTLAIQAGLRVRALRVRLAASLDWVAATVGISSEATGTQASWLVIVDSAGGLRSTWIPVGARVDTVSLDTCLSGSTLIITLAANLHRSTYQSKKFRGYVFIKFIWFHLTDGLAADITLAREARLAGTHHDPGRKCVLNTALSVGHTRINHQARVLAEVSKAGMF